MLLANIATSPKRNEQILVLMNTDPFCNFKSILKMLKKELESNHG